MLHHLHEQAPPAFPKTRHHWPLRSHEQQNFTISLNFVTLACFKKRKGNYETIHILSSAIEDHGHYFA